MSMFNKFRTVLLKHLIPLYNHNAAAKNVFGFQELYMAVEAYVIRTYDPVIQVSKGSIHGTGSKWETMKALRYFGSRSLIAFWLSLISLPFAVVSAFSRSLSVFWWLARRPSRVSKSTSFWLQTRISDGKGSERRLHTSWNLSSLQSEKNSDHWQTMDRREERNLLHHTLQSIHKFYRTQMCQHRYSRMRKSIA